MPAAPALACAASSARTVSAGERGDVSVQYHDVSGEARERSPCGADGVAGAERLLLDGDVEPVEQPARVGRRDDDDPRDACVLRGPDHPVDHPSAEQRVQVLGRRALHARVPRPPAITTAASSSAMSGDESGWGGRIRTSGSRDQNPLPYRLATPHQGIAV